METSRKVNAEKWKQMTFEAVFKTLFTGWNYLYFVF